MRNILKRVIVLIVILAAFGRAQEEPADTLQAEQDSVPKFSYQTIPEFWGQMDDIFDDPAFSNAYWGVVIQSLITGEYFYKRNENKLLKPASNLKLFTTTAALMLLGKDYRFKTEVYKAGGVDGSILNGDLIIKGFGDPTISGRFNNQDMYAVFNTFADSLLDKGIDEIRGKIIGDDNAFDENGLGKGWSWEYESYWFAAPSGALSYNDNCIDISVFPTKKGEQAKIKVMPDTKYTVIVNSTRTVGSDSSTVLDVHRERGTNVIKIMGTISEKEDSVLVFSTIQNPTQFAVVVLKKVLESRGIKVSEYGIDIDDLEYPVDYSEEELLFTHYSVPLTDIIRVTNKNSLNFYAEQILRTIGFEMRGFGSVENGIDAVMDVMLRMGINLDDLNMVDGSGLSPLNLVSPAQIVTLLNQIYVSDLFTDIYNSLAIGGVDGTLANRMRRSRAVNNVRAKAGFLNAARSLSGYIFTGDREPIAFSIIVNNYTVPSVLADRIQDLVCIRLANFRRK